MGRPLVDLSCLWRRWDACVALPADDCCPSRRTKGPPMIDLITYIEQADGPSKGYFTEAAKAAWGWEGAPEGMDPNEWVARWNRFNQMLDAKAWTSAAEMLVPKRATGHVSVNQGYARIENGNGKYHSSDAAHPSLALLAAILRAERNEP